MNGTWLRILSALHASVRQRAGRHPEPTAAIMDSQSVKSTQESGGSKGYDAHKNVVGRKRHILVDTLGPLLSVLVTPADVQTVPAHGV
jgi:putative transposase